MGHRITFDCPIGEESEIGAFMGRQLENDEGEAELEDDLQGDDAIEGIVITLFIRGEETRDQKQGHEAGKACQKRARTVKRMARSRPIQCFSRCITAESLRFSRAREPFIISDVAFSFWMSNCPCLECRKGGRDASGFSLDLLKSSRRRIRMPAIQRSQPHAYERAVLPFASSSGTSHRHPGCGSAF